MGCTLHYTDNGFIFMRRDDDCEAVVDEMLATNYNEEFCAARDWNPAFIARLMKAGFFVMSEWVRSQGWDGNPYDWEIVLPKLHLSRSILFFGNLHVKRSVRRFLSRYELRFDTDFETIVNKCIYIHGDWWLTPSLVRAIFSIREKAATLNRNTATDGGVTTALGGVFPQEKLQHNQMAGMPFGCDGAIRWYREYSPAKPGFEHLTPLPYPRPVSFGLYRGDELVAGDFGVICGRVYSSYSGYKEENNAGTVQLILMMRALEDAGFDFFDFGMPMEYKTDLGATDLAPEDFVRIWREAQA